MRYSEAPKISKQRRASIAEQARELNLELWNNRFRLWPNPPESPLHTVDPGVALTYLGYQVASSDLGQEFIDGRLSEVAGVIDFDTKEVCISTRPSKEEQFFTAAHELGHALLHPGQSGLHRDRPVKGPGVRKDVKEIEADYFASCFLMPEKRVRMSFDERFHTDRLHLDQRTALGLCESEVLTVRSKVRSDRDFSRLLAESKRFDGIRFSSLKAEYLVSTEAMAIRLEELQLVAL